MSRQSRGSVQTEMARFRALIGVSPRVVSYLWATIDPREQMPQGVKPAHLLWCLMFLKVYASESVLCVCRRRQYKGTRGIKVILVILGECT